MKGKRVLLVNLMLLAALLAAPSLVAAAPPVPSDQVAVPAPEGAAPTGFAPATNVPASESLRATLSLKDSLTDAQRAAIDAVLQKYAPQFEAINKALPNAKAMAPESVKLPSASTRPAPPTRAQRLQAMKDARTALKVTAQLSAVQAEIDKDLATILTPEQWAKHRAAISPLMRNVEAAKLAAQHAVDREAPQVGGSPRYYSTYCYYSGLYASLADYYLYYGYVYAYYNYYYNTYGSYNAYYYLYYARVYANAGLLEIGGGYFDLLQWGSDWANRVYYGYNDLYTAYYDGYYGYNYAYSNYASYGYTYAYNAYYYGYYGYLYAYYAYYYGYYCYVS